MVNYKMKAQHKKSHKLSFRWWFGFKRRCPELTRRRTQEIEVIRTLSVTKQKFQSFFASYQSILEDFKITGERIYNMDEMG